MLTGRNRLTGPELLRVLLPKDEAAFARLLKERAAHIDALLDEGRELVERAERLVCRLYRLPRELEDEVVVSAVARAARSAPPHDDADADDSS